jgi:hypothetical protein
VRRLRVSFVLSQRTFGYYTCGEARSGDLLPSSPWPKRFEGMKTGYGRNIGAVQIIGLNPASLGIMHLPVPAPLSPPQASPPQRTAPARPTTLSNPRATYSLPT